MNLNIIVKKIREKCSKFDLYFSESSSESVVFENNKLFMFENSYGSGIGIRVFKNDKTGFSFTSNLSKINQTIEYAVDSSKFGEKIKLNLPPEIQNRKMHKPKIYDASIKELDLKEYVETGKKIIAKLNKHIPANMISLDFSKQTSDDIMLNSNGCRVTEKSTSFGFSLSMVITEKQGLLDIYDGRCSCNLF